MSQDIGPGVRADVLRWASVLAPQPDESASVLLTAHPMTTWLEDAPDEDDLATRISAMRQAFNNLPCCCLGKPDAGPVPVGEFLESAAEFHRYLNAGAVTS